MPFCFIIDCINWLKSIRFTFVQLFAGVHVWYASLYSIVKPIDINLLNVGMLERATNRWDSYDRQVVCVRRTRRRSVSRLRNSDQDKSSSSVNRGRRTKERPAAGISWQLPARPIIRWRLDIAATACPRRVVTH